MTWGPYALFGLVYIADRATLQKFLTTKTTLVFLRESISFTVDRSSSFAEPISVCDSSSQHDGICC